MNDEYHPQPVIVTRGEPTGGIWVVLGLVVMLVGAMLLVDRLNLWGFKVDVPIWPWMLIIMGASRVSYRVADTRGILRVSRSGVWFLIIGVWGLINEYRLFGLHYDQSWPLLIVGAGSMMVWRALDPVEHVRCESRKDRS